MARTPDRQTGTLTAYLAEAMIGSEPYSVQGGIDAIKLCEMEVDRGGEIAALPHGSEQSRDGFCLDISLDLARPCATAIPNPPALP
jgi:hypothetical protein